ncbi:MAG: SpoIIE family protein phosphatase [Planctomycetes bacterium]|nr:SpoIIE family protein phosphatase [Planctomycetota bacterium]
MLKDKVAFPASSAPATAMDAQPRTTMSLRFQLLIGVNATMAVLLTLALVADYQRELTHHLRHEKGALLAEAETIAAALPTLDHLDVKSIQRLLDSIITGMNSTNSPKHRLLVEWNDHLIEPKSAAHDPISLERFKRPGNVRPDDDDHDVWQTTEFVIGMCAKDGFKVHVAEPLAVLQSEIGYETLERLLVLVLAGLIAMGVVDFILLRALVRPMEHLSKTVEAIGGGQLGVQVAQYRTAELAVLAQSINTMSLKLAAHDREVHQQMSKARRLQQHLLPPWPAIAGLTAERRFLPATEVTGDYHEAFPLSDNQWLFCIADVTGHGIPAAMTAAMLKILFHQAVNQTHDPHLILNQLNTNFGEVVLPGDFATMLIVLWQPQQQRICYANAGHEPGLLLRSSGELVLMESDGMMVGVVPESRWELHTLTVSPGDRLFMYTDGAVELFNTDRELFGRKRLTSAFVDTRAANPQQAVAQIIQRLDDFRGQRPFGDDVTLLLMEFADVNSIPVSSE